MLFVKGLYSFEKDLVLQYWIIHHNYLNWKSLPLG